MKKELVSNKSDASDGDVIMVRQKMKYNYVWQPNTAV